MLQRELLLLLKREPLKTSTVGAVALCRNVRGSNSRIAMSMATLRAISTTICHIRKVYNYKYIAQSKRGKSDEYSHMTLLAK